MVIMRKRRTANQMNRAKRLIAKTFEDNMSTIRNDVLVAILSLSWYKRVEFAFRVIFKKL